MNKYPLPQEVFPTAGDYLYHHAKCQLYIKHYTLNITLSTLPKP